MPGGETWATNQINASSSMIQVPTPSFTFSSIFYLHKSTSLSLLFDFSTSLFSFLFIFSSFRFPPFLCFSALSSSREIRKFPPETSAFSEQYSWVFFFSWTIFGLHLLGFLGLRRTYTGLCVHFLYISSILGELVLVFWFFFERVRNTFRLNFDFGRYRPKL